MIRQGLWALAFPFASAALAEGLTLQLPVDCTLGDTCYIQQFMDRDRTQGVTDFRCRGLSYDGHKGTDFAVPTHADMHRGVDVLATADGQVRDIRDGMPDTGFTAETAAAIKGKECGNGVVIQHPGGWETQYCHLKQGSVTVKAGQLVESGHVLGQIGLSGRAQFPHVHLEVRQNGSPVDPFDPIDEPACNTTANSTLWADTPPYVPGGIIAIGIADRVPQFDEVKAGTASASSLTAESDAIVAFAFTFGTQKGDVVRLSLIGPAGEVITQDQTLPRDHAQAFRAVGKKRPRWGGWPAGQYRATAVLLREGTAISTLSRTIEVSGE